MVEPRIIEPDGLNTNLAAAVNTVNLKRFWFPDLFLLFVLPLVFMSFLLQQRARTGPCQHQPANINILLLLLNRPATPSRSRDPPWIVKWAGLETSG